MPPENSINRIEQTRRDLIAAGKKITPLYSGNPGDAGFRFPGDILTEAYATYFKTLEYQPDPKGDILARHAVATDYRNQGTAVDPEHIVLTSGTSESFLHLFSMLCSPGDNVLAPVPSYPLFDHIAQMAHVQLKPYPLSEENGWRLNQEALAAAIDSRTRAIVVISPHNPTGMVCNAEEINFLADLALRRKIPLIVDEVFADFYFGAGSYPRVMKSAEEPLVFTLNGLSKMMALPMLKLGWIVVTGQNRNLVENMVDQLETRTDALLTCHMPLQKSLPILFARGESFRKSYQKEVARRRNAACDQLAQIPQIHFTKPEGGFYLTIGVKTGGIKDEESFVVDLITKTGLMVHPGFFYDLDEGPHLIFSFIHDPQLMTKALNALSRCISAPS